MPKGYKSDGCGRDHGDLTPNTQRWFVDGKLCAGKAAVCVYCRQA